MSEAHEHPHPNYMLIFYILAGATVAEVLVTMIGLSEGVMIALLLAMAFFKAILVALYFMHLKFDNIVLSVIAGIPMVLAAIAFAVVAYETTHDIKHVPPPPANGSMPTPEHEASAEHAE